MVTPEIQLETQKKKKNILMQLYLATAISSTLKEIALTQSFEHIFFMFHLLTFASKSIKLSKVHPTSDLHKEKIPQLTCTSTLRHSPALTNDLATQRAAYDAHRSICAGSLPDRAPPPWAPHPPYVSTIIFRPVRPASPCKVEHRIVQ